MRNHKTFWKKLVALLVVEVFLLTPGGLPFSWALSSPSENPSLLRARSSRDGGALKTLHNALRNNSSAQDGGGKVKTHPVSKGVAERYVAPEILLLFEVAERLGLKIKITGGTARDFAVAAVTKQSHPFPRTTDVDVVIPLEDNVRQPGSYNEAAYKQFTEEVSRLFQERYPSRSVPVVNFLHGVYLRNEYIYEVLRGVEPTPERPDIGAAFSISKLAVAKQGEDFVIEDGVGAIQDIQNRTLRLIVAPGTLITEGDWLGKILGKWSIYQKLGLDFDDPSRKLVMKSLEALATDPKNSEFFLDNFLQNSDTLEGLLLAVDTFDVVNTLHVSRETFVRRFSEMLTTESKAPHRTAQDGGRRGNPILSSVLLVSLFLSDPLLPQTLVAPLMPEDKTYVAPTPPLSLPKQRVKLTITPETKQRLVAYFRGLAKELRTETPYQGAVEFLIGSFEALELEESLSLRGSLIMTVLAERNRQTGRRTVGVYGNPAILIPLMELSHLDPRLNIFMKAILVKETGSLEGAMRLSESDTLEAKIQQYREKMHLGADLLDPLLKQLVRDIFSEWIDGEYLGDIRQYPYLLEKGLQPKDFEELASLPSLYLIDSGLRSFGLQFKNVLKNGKVDERRTKTLFAIAFYNMVRDGTLSGEKAQLIRQVFEAEMFDGNITPYQLEQLGTDRIDIDQVSNPKNFLGFLTAPKGSSKDGGEKDGVRVETPSIVPLRISPHIQILQHQI